MYSIARRPYAFTLLRCLLRLVSVLASRREEGVERQLA
jgi:hypothetical protein